MRIVIPAKAGIHFAVAFSNETDEESKSRWIPAFAGMTNLN
ncbi:hypothetical protein [Pseudoxanthomonas helianthi]|nr:hypothetical protein [Pseudoxanthomonas helianthi]